MKIVTVVGARPQFIKAAALSRLLRQRHQEILVHTGQHYDDNMSRVFFDELDIPEPNINLAVGSSRPGEQTGEMIAGIVPILEAERPDLVLVYGDTNSTLAGALTASLMGNKLAHVEAGLRSFNRSMPEEINRVLTDRASSILFCPSQTAVDNLAREGITQGVHMVGDVMADALAYALNQIKSRPPLWEQYGLGRGEFLLATIHRAGNVDDTRRLQDILAALGNLDAPVLFPVHPRTRKAMKLMGVMAASNVHLIDPVSYLDMVLLEQAARIILTDSGGVQKEAYWLRIPCVTLRDETEWVETVQLGWNVLVGTDKERILSAVKALSPPDDHPTLYGDGHAAARCIAALEADN